MSFLASTAAGTSPGLGAGPITNTTTVKGSGFSRRGSKLCPADEGDRSPSSQKKGLGFLSAMSLGVNVTMGAGFLTCPWAFTQSGIALGTIVMVVLSAAAIFCSLFVVESLARTEAVIRAKEFLLGLPVGGTGAVNKQDQQDNVVVKSAPGQLGGGANDGGIRNNNDDDPEFRGASFGTLPLPKSRPRGTSSSYVERRTGAAENNNNSNNNRGALYRRKSSAAIRKTVSLARQSIAGGEVGHRNNSEEASIASDVEVDEYVDDGEDNNDGGGGDGDIDGNNVLLAKMKSRPPYFRIEARKFEFGQLILLYLGYWSHVAFTVLYCFFGYGTLFNNAQVFAQSLTSDLGLAFGLDSAECSIPSNMGFGGACWAPYAISVIIFAAVVCPLCVIDFKEQIGVQLAMSFMRVGLALLMILTVLADLPAGLPMFSSLPDAPPVSEGGPSATSAGDIAFWFRVAGLGSLVPTAVYSQVMQDCIPSIIQQVEKRGNAHLIIIATMAFTAVLYTVSSAFLGSAFALNDKTVNELIVINWKYYGGQGFSAPWWALIIRYLIVYFPAFAVVSAFPITATVLSNNIAALAMGGDAEDVDLGNHGFWTLFAYRMLAAVPPLVASAFVSSVSSVLDIAGLFGFFVIFIFPPIFGMCALRECVRLWGRKRGSKVPRFSTVLSNITSFWAFLVLGCCVLVFVAVITIGQDFGVPALYEWL